MEKRLKKRGIGNIFGYQFRKMRDLDDVFLKEGELLIVVVDFLNFA